MSQQIICLDDPPTILKQDMCLNELSKDLRGELTLNVSDLHKCSVPECRTLKTGHTLKVEAVSHDPCDSKLGRLLDGTIVVGRLITAFNEDGNRRGFHAGDFEWDASGSGTTIRGRISGVTNVGTHREPAFRECQRCDDGGVMEGRLCGQVVSTHTPELKGCHIVAAYRIKFDPSDKGGEGQVFGTLEGVVICYCQP